jgi:ABC-type Fe3+-siderophore transport system permease subunit
VRNADRIGAALLLAGAVAFSAAALKFYAYWSPEGPGPAFLPFWLGLAMALLSGAMLVRSLRAKARGPDWAPRGVALRHVVVVLAVTTAFVALIKTLGMVLGSALFLAVLVRYLGRHSWWMVLSVAVGAAIFNYWVFAKWLRVPFPEGPFGF